MEKFFTPESVVVVGASAKENSVGKRLADNISRYPEKVYLVNPKGGEVAGNVILKDISKVPDNVDLGVILIRADLIPPTLEALADKGVDTFIVGSGGFSEMGEEGKKLENQVKEIIKSRNLTVVGPNCVGIINTHNDMFATFLNFNKVTKGNIALVTQSGAYAAHIADKYTKSIPGFSKIVSVGNQMDINIKDTIEYLADDPETDAICVYFESIYEGREFIEVCRQTVLKKPIIATSGGHTALGSAAASSHTGALASSSKVLEAALFRAGVIYVEDFDAMFKTAHVLGDQKLPKNDNVAILTNAGGPGVMSTDQLSLQGMGLAELPEVTKAKFREYLHPAASVNNPIDMLAGAVPADYIKAIDILNDEPQVGSMIIVIPPPPVSPMEPFLKEIIPAIKKSPKPVVFYLLGQDQIDMNQDYLDETQTVYFNNPTDAVACLKNLADYGKIKKRLGTTEGGKIDKADSIPDGLSWPEKNVYLQQALIEAGVNSAELVFARDESEVVIMAKEVGYPLAMKIAESKFTHKTDVGGVILNIQDETQLLNVFGELKGKVSKLAGGFTGVFLQGMILEPGQEVIIGAIKDPNFGPMAMFGGGGIEVELYEDVCFGLAPLDEHDVERMLVQTFAGKKLDGIRNIQPGDKAALKVMLINFSRYFSDRDYLAECELNPVIVHKDGEGATAVDFRFSEDE